MAGAPVNRGGESLTIVHRDGELLVGGYAKSWEWSNEVRKPDGELDVETEIGGCDIDFLSGKAVVSEGLDEEEKPIQGKFTPVKLADWPAEELPEACDFFDTRLGLSPGGARRSGGTMLKESR